MAKNLIIYYSRRGENYFNGAIKSLEQGNTEICVKFIQQAVGGDVFQVETVKTYPAYYMACLGEALAEQRSNTRPELKNYLSDIGDYDNVFICGPCWWGTFPMAIFTQLEKLDWKGKKVMVLMTHEGSGLGNCEKDLKKVCAGSRFGKSLAVFGTQAADSEKEVADWARSQI